MIDTEQIINDFVAYRRALNFSEATASAGRNALRIFFDFIDSKGIQDVAEIKTKQILEFQIHLSAFKNTKGEAYNPKSQNAIVTNVRKMFQYLRRQGKVFYDPTVDVELAKTTRSLPRNILSEKEMRTLLSAPKGRLPLDIRDKAVLETLYATGMRNSELTGLDLTDLNFDDRTIFIREGKGGKDRVVPMTKSARRTLKKYINDVRRHMVADPSEQAVFINKDGKRLGKQGLWCMVKRRAKQAGIEKDICPHSIRHSIATHLASTDCNLRYIQELLGHSRCDTTAIYIQVSGSRLRQAIEKYHPSEAGEKVA
ncbi:MAG: tyrosine-type recombinase/integrase [Actinobacteria bacterium]|nr:tyrosine-type recombinase/integrase [Actinomycetota bacterium]